MDRTDRALLRVHPLGLETQRRLGGQNRLSRSEPLALRDDFASAGASPRDFGTALGGAPRHDDAESPAVTDTSHPCVGRVNVYSFQDEADSGFNKPPIVLTTSGDSNHRHRAGRTSRAPAARG